MRLSVAGTGFDGLVAACLALSFAGFLSFAGPARSQHVDFYFVGQGHG